MITCCSTIQKPATATDRIKPDSEYHLLTVLLNSHIHLTYIIDMDLLVVLMQVNCYFIMLELISEATSRS